MSERGDQRERLPSGTVTLLFADVEGSTRLLTLLGDRYLPVRARSRELVREVAGAHRGHEVDWAGDGVFLAFERAGDAVSAAAELQRALAREPWAPDGAVRLRMGIHTGEPELDGEGYVGIDVVVAARICAAAHGGQVVVSTTTRQLVGDEPVPSGSFQALGTFRLKDVRDSAPLFQLVAPGLVESFPPLTTLGGGTLPTLHHRLVGRTAQVAEIERLLGRADVRLVTITGSGGAGKSRLALEVASAAATARPVYLVGLAPVSDAELVPEAIARVLGVQESPAKPLLTGISEALEGTRTLLYLDNLEHLPEATGHVRSLLDAVPDLDVLATSRSPLRLSGEHVLPLEPLTTDEAVELFVGLTGARGLRIGDDLVPTIRSICERVDCLPLAIEVVAARLAVFSAGQLLDALDQGVVLDLEGPVDLPERQKTLRATLDWSYDLLTESQQALYGALAVFSGGSTLEDARAVAGNPPRFLSDLETLVLGSLVKGSAGVAETRLTLLETVREHALSRLVAGGQLEALRARHAERFLELAFAAEEGLEGPLQASWLERLESELDNIRAALGWCLASGRVEEALRSTSALLRFWRAHGHVGEARRFLAAALASSDGVSPEIRGDALWTAAQQATAQSDWDAAIPLLTEALDLFRAGERGRETIFVLCDLGWIALMQDDLERAAELCEQALAAGRALEDPRALSAALNGLGEIRSLQGDHDRALACYEEAVALRRALGDPLLVADALYHLGATASRSGDTTRARGACEEALAIARELSEAPHIASVLFTIAELDLGDGNLAGAEAAITESLAIFTELDNQRARAGCLIVLAAVVARRGERETAARLLGAASSLRGESPPNALEAPILNKLVPELENALGREHAATLIEDGARAGDSLVLEVVTIATSE
ncbi:MAG: tetratricopeptide repeat protein [Gaiellaceae bacterium]